MATVLIASLLDGACQVTFTTSGTDTVTAASIVNNSAQTVTLTLTDSNGPANTKAVPPGTNATVNLSKGKQFSLSANPYSVQLAVP